VPCLDSARYFRKPGISLKIIQPNRHVRFAHSLADSRFPIWQVDWRSRAETPAWEDGSALRQAQCGAPLTTWFSLSSHTVRTISALLDDWKQADRVEKDKKLRLQGNFYKDRNEYLVTEH